MAGHTTFDNNNLFQALTQEVLALYLTQLQTPGLTVSQPYADNHQTQAKLLAGGVVFDRNSHALANFGISIIYSCFFPCLFFLPLIPFQIILFSFRFFFFVLMKFEVNPPVGTKAHRAGHWGGFLPGGGEIAIVPTWPYVGPQQIGIHRVDFSKIYLYYNHLRFLLLFFSFLSLLFFSSFPFLLFHNFYWF